MSFSPLNKFIIAIWLCLFVSVSYAKTIDDCPGLSRDIIQQAYIAYYGRPGDPEGVMFWCEKLDSEGGSLESIIDQFGNSTEFDERYGSLSNTTLIDTIYLQLFGREPDSDGKTFYLNKLENGEMTLQTITLDVLYGSTDSDALVIEKKTDLANYFTHKLGNSNFEYDKYSIESISLLFLNIDDTTSSFIAVMREINTLFESTLPVDNTQLCVNDFEKSAEHFESFSSSKGKLFYLSNNGQSLHYINLETGQTKLISDSLPINTSDVYFSTYGRYVLYLKEEVDGRFLYVSDIVTDEELRVPRSGHYWSPEESFFYVRGTFYSYLGLGPLLGDHLRVETGFSEHIAWSKDESKLALATEDSQAIYSTAAGEIIRSFDITSEGAGSDRYNVSFTSFSPDGLYLVYGTEHGETVKVYVMELSTGVRKLIASSEYYVTSESYAWSPSSKYIAIEESNPEHPNALNVYHVQSNYLEPITRSSDRVREFKWSPKEDKLAYSAFEGYAKYGHIYIKDFSTPNKSSKSLILQEISGISWSPDSRYLAYYDKLMDSTYRLSLVDPENSCYENINGLAINFSSAPVLWSPSSKYILYSASEIGVKNLFVITGDGSQIIPLSDYTQSADDHQITDFRWVPASDTIFYAKRTNNSTADTVSIHTLEIESFISTSVNSTDDVGFGENVWLFP